MKTLINKFLLLLASILAINACDPMVAYGTPYSDYEEREQIETDGQGDENDSDETAKED